MAYDERLAERVRDYLQEFPNVEEKKMFGGLCFMVSRHMCCGILEDKLLARIGADKYEIMLSREYTRKMDFTGRPMKGIIYVEPEGLKSDDDLKEWVDICLNFISNLPEKT